MDEKIFSDVTLCATEFFGITDLKPYQTLVTSRIVFQDRFQIHSRDQVVILPTGMGKSVCFLIPAILCNGITIVVFPLLALINDQLSKLDRANVGYVVLRGGQTPDERRKQFSRLADGSAKIVVTTPETLSNKSVLTRLSKHQISLFVVDEAHFIPQWGKEFRPAYARLGEMADVLRPRQRLAFTATAGEETLRAIRKSLFRRPPLVVRGDADRENIRYAAYPYIEKTMATAMLVRDNPRPTLVFCTSRADTQVMCEQCARLLRDIPVRYYHAGLSHEERVALEAWFRTSKDGVLCATSAYGTGIDKPDVRTVIHHGLPESPEEYLQESGRCGRDGAQAWAWVLVPYYRGAGTGSNTETELEKVFLGEGCRRHALLSFLGQDKHECSGCDVCERNVVGSIPAVDAAERLVRGNPFVFTPRTAAQVLVGMETRSTDDTMRSCRFWGILPDWDAELLEAGILEMMKADAIGGVGVKNVGVVLFDRNSRLLKACAQVLRRLYLISGRRAAE